VGIDLKGCIEKILKGSKLKDILNGVLTFVSIAARFSCDVLQILVLSCVTWQGGVMNRRLC